MCSSDLSTVTNAAKDLGQNVLRQRQSGGLNIAKGTGMLGAAGDVRVKDHTFYGMENAKDD